MQEQSQFQLLSQKRFGPFFITQFLGAFNDNVFKNALIIILTFKATQLASLDSNTLVNLSAALFILPFFLFSSTAGQIADKYEKSNLIRQIKKIEIAIMLLAALGFYSNNLILLMACLFLMGLQSASFGPIKYGILPQYLKPEELVGGNGLVEMGTFLSILLGTMLGGYLISLDGGAYITAMVVILVAILGYCSSCFIPRTTAQASELKINWNIISESWGIIKLARRRKTVFLSVLGISWFWFLGSLYLAQFPNYTKLILGGNEQVVVVLLTTFSLGIGLGSLLCEKLSGHIVEIGLVPFGAIGLTLFGIDLYFVQPEINQALVGEALLDARAFLQATENLRVLFDLLLLGMFGGFYIVPLYALVQQRSEAQYRSRIIAANNILNAFFMVMAALIAIVLLKSGLSIPQLFLAAAIMNAAVTLYIFNQVPEFLMRFLVWILIHTIYRVKKTELQHIPDRGAAVLVCNHVSFVDALIIAGCVRRPVRFVMYYKIFSIPILNFIFKTAKAIPIAGAKEDPDMLEKAYDEIEQALTQGELICIFPEGKITHDGVMNTFRPGIENIIKRNPVPVIPMALRGLWGSIFSRKGEGIINKIPKRIWFKIELIVGGLVEPADVQASDLEKQVGILRGDWK